MNRRLGKRGISPLIATVVLIAFAVSLGAVVMNLGKSIAPNAGIAQAKECVGLRLVFSGQTGSEVTFGGSGASGFLDFVMDNPGTDTIPQVRLRVIGEKQGTKQTFNLDLENSLVDPGVQVSKRVAYDYDLYGKPATVEIVPLSSRNGKKLPCLSGAALFTAK